MPDETDQVTPVMPPPAAAIPRGTGYTYSTPGPGNWQNPQTVSGPAGVPVQIPQNAQNFASVVGPTPEDQETAAFRRMFNSLPMDQAIKAYQAAKQFQGQRVLQTKLAGYSAAGLPPEQALSKAMTDAASVGLFSTPKELLDLNKNLSTAATDKAKAQFDARKYAQDQINARAQARQQFELQRMQLGQGGMNARQQLAQYESDRSILQRALDKADEGLGVGVLDAEGKAAYDAKVNQIKTIDAEMNKLRKQLGLVVPDTVAAAPAPTGKPKPGDIRKGTSGNYRFKGGDPSKKQNWEKVQ